MSQAVNIILSTVALDLRNCRVRETNQPSNLCSVYSQMSYICCDYEHKFISWQYTDHTSSISSPHQQPNLRKHALRHTTQFYILIGTMLDISFLIPLCLLCSYCKCFTVSGRVDPSVCQLVKGSDVCCYRETVETVGWPCSALHSGPYSQTLGLTTWSYWSCQGCVRCVFMVQELRKSITRLARALMNTPATGQINSSNRNSSRDTAHWSKTSLSAGPVSVPSMSVVLNGPVIITMYPLCYSGTKWLRCLCHSGFNWSCTIYDSGTIWFNTVNDSYNNLTVLYHGGRIAYVPSLPRIQLFSWSVCNIPSLVNI